MHNNAIINNQLSVSVPEGYKYEEGKTAGPNYAWIYFVPESYSLEADHKDAKPIGYAITSFVWSRTIETLNTENTENIERIKKELLEHRHLVPNVKIFEYFCSDTCGVFYQNFTDDTKLCNGIRGCIVDGKDIYFFHIFANHDTPIACEQKTINSFLKTSRVWIETISQLSSSSKDTEINKLTRVSPDKSLFPHYQQKREYDKYRTWGMTVIDTPDGTDYEFLSLGALVENEFELNELGETIKRITSLDKGYQTLYKDADIMRHVFRVNKTKFDEVHDRECQLKANYIQSAYQLHALRSFAWTLTDYCKTNHAKPGTITVDFLKEIVDFSAKNEWLNYSGKKHCKALCGCCDLHVYYIPDSVTEQDRVILLPTQEEIDQVKSMQEKYPQYHKELNQVASLDELRKELEYIYPAIKLLWNELKRTRDYDVPLEGDVADVVYAWCALALASASPFYVEDGPRKCSFTQLDDTTDYSLLTSTKTHKSRSTQHFYSEEALAEKQAKKEAKANKGSENETKTKETKPAKKKAVYEGPAKMTIVDGLLKKYEGNEETVVIPDGVTAIGKNVFKGNESIKKVVLPEGLLLIDDAAFRDCINLVDINWVNTIEDIGKRAFMGCTSLETVIIPGNTINLWDNSFDGCTSLKTVVIHPDVSHIDSGYLGYEVDPFRGSLQGTTVYAKKGSYIDKEYIAREFQYKKDVKVVYDFPEDIMPKCTLSPEKKKQKQEIVLWDNTLYKYNGNEDTFIIPYGVKTIERLAFSNGTSEDRQNRTLKHIIIPNTVKTIKWRAFAGCAVLESIAIPYGVKGLQQSLFDACSNLKYVTIPDTVEKIESYVFSDCNNLTSVNLPKGLQKIDEKSFGYGDPKQVSSEKPNLTIYGYSGTVAEAFADAKNLRFSTGLPKGVPAPRTADTPDPTEKALKEKAAADERRQLEEKRRLAEEKQRAEKRAKREAEAKRLEEERQAKVASQKQAWRAQLDALNQEKQDVLKTIEQNKGIFGEKARRRKEAQQKLAEINAEIAQLEKML